MKNTNTLRRAETSDLPLSVRERIHRSLIELADQIIDGRNDIEPEIVCVSKLPLSEILKEISEFGIDIDERWGEFVRCRKAAKRDSDQQR